MTVENISIDVKTNAGSAAKQFRSLSSAISGVSKSNKAISGVANSAKAATKHTSTFASSLIRIAKYRILRTALKDISQAFNEGLKNAYNFSKGIGGTLAAAMDSLATKSLTMKNQLGAALGNLLTAITPILLQIISLATQAAQALAALFSALGGGQYLVAKDVAQSWDKATGAAQKYKKTLLGFDEINRLDEPSGGGGGAAVDASKMFEVSELPPWAQWIKDHLEEIKKLAVAIGAAILAWKIGSFISDLMSTNSALKQVLGIAMSIVGALLLVQGAIGAIKNGLDWGNLLEMLGGAALLVAGLGTAFGKTAAAIGAVVSGITILGVSLADAFKSGVNWKNLTGMISGTALVVAGLATKFGAVGAAIGMVVGGVALLIAGFKDWIETGELSAESFVAIEAGIMLLGGGIALLTHSWIPLVIAAVAGIALAVITHWDEIKKWTSETWDKIKTWTVETWDKVKTKISESVQNAKERISTTWGNIKSFFQETVPEIVSKVGDWFSEMPGKIGYFLGETVKRFENWGIDAMNWFKEKVPELVNKIEGWFGELPGKVKAKLDDVKEKFSEWKTATSTWVKEKVPEIVNSIEGFFAELPDKILKIGENIIKSLWQGIQNAWSWVSTSIKGIGDSISNAFNDFTVGFTAGYNSIPLHADGGTIENNGSLFVAGEAGPEIVANMGSKTGVMNVEQMEAAVSNGNIGVINAIYGMANAIVRAVENIDPDITLDGQSLADKMYHYNQQAANRYGAAMVT